MSSAVKRLRAEARDLAKNGQDSTIYLEMDEDQLKGLTKEMKKKFACNGTIVKDEKLGNILQLQGDIREQAKELLIKKYNYLEENIVTHGYD